MTNLEKHGEYYKIYPDFIVFGGEKMLNNYSTAVALWNKFYAYQSTDVFNLTNIKQILKMNWFVFIK